MHRIGLALSGGGFRATLFHLGMVRFLREADILPSVTHITSVSGGSILAAHLVLNWDRYNGSLHEFDAAAAELLRFVRLDVRNRVVRRYPLALPLRGLRRLALLGPNRRLTRTGLLEYHYDKYLYGDTCLFQLPERPRLYILATNLSEGCLCAFTREGLLMQRRLPGQRFRFDRIHTGLATVPMAVTASSAFPGFFPPLELRGEEVGADPGHFGRVAFTDGGVYDNLGVRMFRCLERSLLAREIRLRREDLADADQVRGLLAAAAQANEDTPLHRLAQMVDLPREAAGPGSADAPVDCLLNGLWDVMNNENLAREPVFARLSAPDPDVEQLLHAARNGAGAIEPGDQMWLNRRLVEAAFRQATGQSCFRSPNPCFDAVLVSDAGKQFKIASDARAGGLITTSMRATDIAMDRVWQLEIDTFTGTPGFVFAPITKVVEPDEDPTALHPEVQRMATDIRTDLDRFSPLEIRSLVQHGYCVGRSACRSRADLFGATMPAQAPWDPLPGHEPATKQPSRPVAAATLASDKGSKPAPKAALEAAESRQLQQSAGRRLWSTLLDYRDWTSYVYVPLLIPILLVLPYYGVKWYRQSQVIQRLIEGLAQNNGDFEVMSKLLQEGPSAPFRGMAAQEKGELAPLDYSGFEVIADTRVLDFRPWKIGSKQADERSYAYAYRRTRVKKLGPTAREFVIRVRGSVAKAQVRSLTDRFPAELRSGQDKATDDGKPVAAFDMAFDLTKAVAQDVVDLSFEVTGEPPPQFLKGATMDVDAKTALLTCWLLLPDGKHYQGMELLRYPAGNDSSPERMVPASEIVSPNGQIAAFALLSLEPGCMYERRWTYRD
ncbi:MAG: patatin-like phospholipase family protein [Gemmataceae bacterium]|nr:patatin-like phospholipase family protein [Gemmataceae bacterium]